jgi:ketosteroid isomerase-like protein
MSRENVELRAMAETAYGALNSGDLDGFLALVADDVEFTSMVAGAEGTTFRGREGVRCLVGDGPRRVSGSALGVGRGPRVR